jgi:hypothetical protein
MVFGDQFLAGDAVLNPWNRVEALDADLRSAIEALPECAETNPLQCRIDRAEQGMVARFLPEIDLPAATRQLSKVRDNPLDPVQLFFDKAGDLIVVSCAGNGTVYSFKPEAGNDDITLLPAVPAVPRPGVTPVLPVDYWRNENDFLEVIPAKPLYQFVSQVEPLFFRKRIL